MKNTQEPQSLPLTLPHQRAKILNQTQALTNPSAYHFYLTSVNFSPRFNQLLKFWFLIINRHTAYFIKSFKWCFLQFITNRGLSFFFNGWMCRIKMYKKVLMFVIDYLFETMSMQCSRWGSIYANALQIFDVPFVRQFVVVRL